MGVAIAVAFLARSLIIWEVIPWDVSDGRGTGPDPGGGEWANALSHQATDFSVRFGLLIFGGLLLLLTALKKYRRAPQIENEMPNKSAMDKPDPVSS